MKVNLEDVMEAIEYENESVNHYYNKETGVIIYIEDSESSSYSADDFGRIDEFEDWEKELIEVLYHFRENPNNYIQLPTLKDINEDLMMIEFILSLEDFNIDRKKLEEFSSKELMGNIKGQEKLNEWFDFRADTDRVLAISWCRKHNIEF